MLWTLLLRCAEAAERAQATKAFRSSHRHIEDLVGNIRLPSSNMFPARYRESWTAAFRANIEARLVAGMTVLDIGGGRHPAVPSPQRPDNVAYVGLDPDLSELDAAPTGSYDRKIVASAEDAIPDLAGTIDLIVSWQVFEHVRSLDAVLRNSHDYLAPSGSLVSVFSGRWSAFAVLNRMLPSRLGEPIVNRVAQRSANNKPIFPAYYDSCSFTAVRRLTIGWTNVEIIPFYRGAGYFGFARPLLRTYLAYENTAQRRGWRDCATHYLLIASR